MKNRKRLMAQIRRHSEESWHHWAQEIREELSAFWPMHLAGTLATKPSKLRTVDKYRRLFDSHGSNPLEAVEMPDNHPTYWKELSGHEGGSYAGHQTESCWDAYIRARQNPGYNPETHEIWDQSYARVIR